MEFLCSNYLNAIKSKYSSFIWIIIITFLWVLLLNQLSRHPFNDEVNDDHVQKNWSSKILKLMKMNQNLQTQIESEASELTGLLKDLNVLTSNYVVLTKDQIRRMDMTKKLQKND